ncbi:MULTISPECIES: hypothetical protein [unclassified Rhodosalinus]|uniref:hypothetical protein n=1 Tax=unclassified Rhodosalinus TaxID=2630183 RepID=UPI003524D51E
MRGRRRAIIAALAAAATLAACGQGQSRVAFDGNIYPASVSTIGGEREKFTISVRNAGQGLAGAREAGRYEATVYCIRNYGSSAVRWTLSPDAEASALRIENGALLLQGECLGW